MNKGQINNTLLQLGNKELPLAHRASQMVDIMAGAQGGDRKYTELVNEIFERLSSGSADQAVQQRLQFLDAMLGQIEAAPMRAASFIQLTNLDGSPSDHALVCADNGELAYVVVHDPAMAKDLKLGDRIMLDAHSKILMHPALNELHFGPQGRLERRIDERHIEVITHQDERVVVLADKELVGQIASGKIVPGSQIVIGAGGRMATYALPPEEKTYFRFLDRGAIPDVVVDRDIGSPPKVIAQVTRHIREEMLRPELRRKFHLRPCITKLLCGVSGSGKTLAMQAIHRIMYEVMSEVTGVPMDQLPHRVFRFKTSQMLSMWLGESDKNYDRLFDEVELMASKPFHHDGKDWTLPVMVVMEEADGMGRTRGQGADAVYDRILTTLLQRLDPNRHGLSNRLIVFLSTTNEPHIVDPAFLRRIGGTVETFGRLDRDAFEQIIGKHIDGLPAAGNHKTQKKAWQATVEKITDWLFTEGKDKPVVELTYHGEQQPVPRFRREFLTGALIDRSVQEAATKAWEMAISEDPDAGISMEQMGRSINNQVMAVVNQMTIQNVHSYLDLPDGVRVTGIRRIPQD